MRQYRAKIWRERLSAVKLRFHDRLNTEWPIPELMSVSLLPVLRATRHVDLFCVVTKKTS